MDLAILMLVALLVVMAALTFRPSLRRWSRPKA